MSVVIQWKYVLNEVHILLSAIEKNGTVPEPGTRFKDMVIEL